MIAWKRGFLEIISEILEVLSESPLKKSHISFKTSLDSRAVSKYLAIMKKIGLIKRKEDDISFFTVTKKGMKFLESYRELVKFVKK